MIVFRYRVISLYSQTLCLCATIIQLLVESEHATSLIHQEGERVRRTGHVAELEERPAEAVCFTAHHGKSADTLHREDKEEEDREAGHQELVHRLIVERLEPKLEFSRPELTHNGPS